MPKGKTEMSTGIVSHITHHPGPNFRYQAYSHPVSFRRIRAGMAPTTTPIAMANAASGLQETSGRSPQSIQHPVLPPAGAYFIAGKSLHPAATAISSGAHRSQSTFPQPQYVRYSSAPMVPELPAVDSLHTALAIAPRKRAASFTSRTSILNEGLKLPALHFAQSPSPTAASPAHSNISIGSVMSSKSRSRKKIGSSPEILESSSFGTSSPGGNEALSAQRTSSAGHQHRFCKIESCGKRAVKNGVCVSHGAKVKHPRCKVSECAKQAVQGGVCITHGAKVRYNRCKVEGCTKYARTRGVCVEHGATSPRCKAEGCDKQAVQGGVCIGHGARVKYFRCKVHGCSSHAGAAGVCLTHRFMSEYEKCKVSTCRRFAKISGHCIMHAAQVSSHHAPPAC